MRLIAAVWAFGYHVAMWAMRKRKCACGLRPGYASLVATITDTGDVWRVAIDSAEADPDKTFERRSLTEALDAIGGEGWRFVTCAVRFEDERAVWAVVAQRAIGGQTEDSHA